MGDHVLTLIAYGGISVATGWWFWRAHAGFLSPAAHAVVAVIFGVSWPISIPWRALVRAVSCVIEVPGADGSASTIRWSTGSSPLRPD